MRRDGRPPRHTSFAVSDSPHPTPIGSPPVQKRDCSERSLSGRTVLLGRRSRVAASSRITATTEPLTCPQEWYHILC